MEMSIYRGQGNHGFIGLIAILITALIIAWWAIYYSPLASYTSDTGEKRNVGLDAIDDANSVKSMLEKRDASLPL